MRLLQCSSCLLVWVLSGQAAEPTGDFSRGFEWVMSLSKVKPDSIWLKHTGGSIPYPVIMLWLCYANTYSIFLKWWLKRHCFIVSDLKLILCPKQIPGTFKEVSLTLAFLSFLSLCVSFFFWFTLWEKGGCIFHIFLGHFKSHQYLPTKQGSELVQNNFLFIFLSCPSSYWPSFNPSLWWYLTLSLACFSVWFLAF